MAWFKKERKPRTSQRERLEIPADAWEKCDSCGHIDIREKFEKALNVCPECGRHRRIQRRGVHRAADRCRAPGASSTPASVPRSPELRALCRPAQGRPGEGRRSRRDVHRHRPAGRGAVQPGGDEFPFMGGSMGSVVGEKIARLARRSAREEDSAGDRLHVRRRPDAGGRALADADGQDVGRHRRSSTATPSPTSPS